MHSILKSMKEGLAGELTDFAVRLIKTPTPSGQEQAAADLVAAEMERLRFDRVVRDEAGNVVGVLFGRESAPALLLQSHLDTVPAAADSRPDGTVEEGRLYGRGASDCKGGLAAQVYAGALLKRSLLPLQGTLVVAATVAEENGMSHGTRTLLSRTLPALGLKPQYAILGEPTGLALYYGHDGWMEVDVTVAGANPFQVRDAAEAILADFSCGRNGGDAQLSIEAPSYHAVRGVQRAVLHMTRRMGESENSETVMGQLRRDATQAAHPSSSVAVEMAVPERESRLYNGTRMVSRRVTHAWSIDPYSPLIQRSRESLAAAQGGVRVGKWKLGRLGMGTAGGVFVNEFRIPCIGYGPGSEDLAHAANESVEISALQEATYGTAAIAHGLVGIPVCGWTSDEI